MKAKLLNDLSKAKNIIFTACRTCYSAKSPIELIEQEPNTDLILKIARSGHLSTFEHVNCTFAIEGVSRSLLAQLTRHRLCSFSVQSQRYCKMDNNFVVPETLKDNKEIIGKTLNQMIDCYNELIENGAKKEDARAILPNATCTNLVMTCNLRELIHICNLRLCKRAQTEIRELTDLMRKEVIKELPFMKEFLVPNCKHCTEAKGCKNEKNM
jgi:thymidylate synthase (FAD)